MKGIGLDPDQGWKRNRAKKGDCTIIFKRTSPRRL